MHKLIAIKKMTYGGRSLSPGDEFEAEDRFVRVLVAMGRAKRSKPVSLVSEEAVSQPPRPRRRRYSRRDMVAEHE